MVDVLSNEKLDAFWRDGYVVVESFLSNDETNALKDEFQHIVDVIDPSEEKAIFASKPKNQNSHVAYEENEYFLNSGDKIRYFFEEDAFDGDGNLKFSKHQSLNKIGHALHMLNPTFNKITFSSKVKSVVRSLNLADPVIIQSMYITKSPFIGSEVLPHQDETYLYCEPDNKVFGLWIALEKTDIENGCLWFIPGSHKDPVERRMIREEKDGRTKLTYLGSNPDYSNRKFVPVPVESGDLIILHGKVVHRSDANNSFRPRPIYTFHILDKSDSRYSELNWLQETNDFKFSSLLRE